MWPVFLTLPFIFMTISKCDPASECMWLVSVVCVYVVCTCSCFFVVQHSALCSEWRVTRGKGHLDSADQMTVYCTQRSKSKSLLYLRLIVDWPYHNFCSALILLLTRPSSDVYSLAWRGEQKRDEGWGCFCIPADLSSAHYHSTLESVHIFISSLPEICPPTHKIRMRKLPIFKL